MDDMHDASADSVPVESFPPPGYPRKRARTRRLLMIAALKEISEKGPAAISVGGVAGRAKVATGTFYNHFADLDTLKEVIVDDLAAAVEIGHGRLAAIDSDPAMTIALAIRQLLVFTRHDPKGVGAFVRMMSTMPELRGRVRSTVSLVVSAGIESGRFQSAASGVVAGASATPPARLYADAVVGTMLNWMRTIVAGEEDSAATEQDYVTHVLSIVGVPPAEIGSILSRLEDIAENPAGVR